MPTTRKKVIKTVYKDESDSENEGGDFSDSGSEAEIFEDSDSDNEDIPSDAASSGDEFIRSNKPQKIKTYNRKSTSQPKKKTDFAKSFVSKINKVNTPENRDVTPNLISVKDLTEADKLLPSVLNLSDSESSDEESTKTCQRTAVPTLPVVHEHEACSDSETKEYMDVWSNNMLDDSEEIAKRTFIELEKHKTKIETTKASIQSYKAQTSSAAESNVNDLLALGEEVLQEIVPKKPVKGRRKKIDSESENEDWEEVQESKAIPSQGLQLIVDFPNTCCKKTKTLDVEMMMKRKINRTKKEYQVYMHKVHVLCWLGHGNFISGILNNQEILAASLSLVPSKECYPGERVDMKYVEQITKWYHDKMTIVQDKYEDKFRPKAPPLKDILLTQIKSKKVTTKKYLVFIFVSMLRALGLQCRVMFNFVTIPLKPPSSELCSLSTKPKSDSNSTSGSSKERPGIKNENNVKTKTNLKSRKKISQVDGNDDSSMGVSDSDFENIMQIDGNDDTTVKTKRTQKTKSSAMKENKEIETDVSPPKRARRSPITKTSKSKTPERKVTSKYMNNKSNGTNESTPSLTPKTPQTRKRTKLNVDKIDNIIQSEDDAPNPKIQSSRRRNVKLESDTPTSNTRPSRRRSTKPENSPSNQPCSIIKPSRSRIAKPDDPVGDLPPSIKKLSRRTIVKSSTDPSEKVIFNSKKDIDLPKIIIKEPSISEYFESPSTIRNASKLCLKRNRSQTTNPSSTKTPRDNKDKPSVFKSRTQSAPENVPSQTSKYFNNESPEKPKKMATKKTNKGKTDQEDKQRVSHRDIVAKGKTRVKNDVTSDLISIVKNRIREAKSQKTGIVKGKVNEDSDNDSDYLPLEAVKNDSEEEEFKPSKIRSKPSTSRKIPKSIDRRVLSSDDDAPKNKIDVWCEIFVEELEQWISVDVVKAQVHCTSELYSRATHPVCYVVGWDNNNFLKDLTRRYVPHWNTITRKQRAEPEWWSKAIAPWLGPKNARDKEEDEQLDRMQLEAPLPKSIAEYKNHPLYALKRHLLKFEALYPPDAATLGFVRGEPVYARDCVYVCRSRDTWLKEAKVVRLGEKPYKVVKARPKWDRLSNKLITDKPLEVFGPWQVQDYEPPVAENGIVPRNAYGNVELFKECMLPKGTVHVKLPGLNKVARKLNIDCAPAMTGFDFNGGWSHPVYDGFVVCKEFEEIVTEAWLKDQEEQERREREKTEARVYGNWKKLIKGLLIRERLKNKYGFAEPSTSDKNTKKSKGPKLVVKKKS